MHESSSMVHNHFFEYLYTRIDPSRYIDLHQKEILKHQTT